MDNLILSQDGSHTVVSQKFGVSYHSKYGAIQETQTVFIDAGLNFKVNQGLDSISILGMGFGTGLNALMTLMQTDLKIKISYNSIEAYPISEDQFTALNYPEILNLEKSDKEAFMKMHRSQSREIIALKDHFTFTKHIQKIEDFATDIKFDVIYYDAFAPSSQEELWTESMMIKLFGMCNPGAVLVTYCAKGSFKRALRAAGFTVEGIDGPIGKREMTRAHVPIPY